MRFLSNGFYQAVVGIVQTHFERFGVGPSGPMDLRAYRLNHLILGNREEKKVLEMTGLLPTIGFEEAVSCAVTGKPVKIVCDGHLIPMCRSFDVLPGSVLSFERLENGGWTYFGVGGGIEEISGRQVRLKAPTLNGWVSFLPDDLYREAPKDEPIRVVAGPEWDWFDSRAQEAFLNQNYRVDSIDRMGYRLQGKPILLRKPRELISSPVSTGTVQVTGSGQPVVLMAGRQTIGGYPRIAFVSPTDLSRLSQTGEGEIVRFRKTSIEEAEQDWKAENEQLLRLAQILKNQRTSLLFSASVQVSDRRFYVQMTR